MKLSELIHNGLYLIEGRTAKYDTVFSEFKALNGDAVWKLDTIVALGCDVRVSWAKVLPLPITEKILKANGWEKEQIQDKYHYYHPEVPFSVINEENVYQRIIGSVYLDATIFNIHYAHQLQHLLYICGLDELADSFKLG